jgi:1-acyl-sn-glycerol-3-phosphate acyltransferase
MRSLAFNIFFFVVTFLYGVSCLLFSLVPGRAALMAALRRYTKLMVWGMRRIGGMDIQITGQEHIPASGPVIIAPKHQSYGDGFVIFSEFKDLSVVTGNHLEKYWGLKRILSKMNAVVIDNCGGSDSQKKMEKQAEDVRKEGRRLLIFPEGHLSKIGTHHRYRKGVWHLQQDFNCPVIPVANTLGQRWNQTDWAKYTGRAHIEFLEPIAPGLDKDDFMTLLQDQIETRSIELLDLDNPGALDPADIGKLEENHVALAKRLAREAEAG